MESAHSHARGRRRETTAPWLGIVRHSSVDTAFGFALDGQIVIPHIRVGRQPVDEQQGELLIGPAVHPDVHVRRPAGIGRAVNPLVPQAGSSLWS